MGNGMGDALPVVQHQFMGDLADAVTLSDKVDAVRGIELVDGNCVDVSSGGHVVRQNGLHPLVEWLTAGPAAENVTVLPLQTAA